ncbi:hypothetical protein [Diaphorobacter caeni]|uniref:hypothetical protein n=1 Tax=Diaphorobacter caeni TaxID=2784387 RepID=UPI001890B45B|nr:hypothetical protein [Diaphorobacter caeni]MBF5006013.1 hypothetical protein [Diaphorobacter caeni]
MTTGLKTVKPLVVSDTTLVSQPAVEDSAPAWVAGTPYAAGSFVRYQHIVYKNGAATSGMIQPPLDGMVWVAQYPTNTWSLFDPMTSKATAIDNTLSYTFKFGQTANGVFGDGLENVQRMQVTVTDPNYGEVYKQTMNVGRTIARSSWYLWHFGPREQTGVLGYFTDLPDFPQATIKVEFFGTTGMKVRNLIVGIVQEWGLGVELGASIDFEDYSIKTRDEYGNLKLVPRQVIRETSMSVPLKRREVDGFVKFIQDRSAKPTFFIGSSDIESLNTFGVATANIAVQYHDISKVSLKVQSAS